MSRLGEIEAMPELVRRGHYLDEETADVLDLLIRAVRQLSAKLGKERIRFLATTNSIDPDILELLEGEE